MKQLKESFVIGEQSELRVISLAEFAACGISFNQLLAYISDTNDFGWPIKIIINPYGETGIHIHDPLSTLAKIEQMISNAGWPQRFTQLEEAVEFFSIYGTEIDMRDDFDSLAWAIVSTFVSKDHRS